MGPMILGLTVTQINTLADDLIALCFSNEQGRPLGWGAVSHLYFAQRLYQFPLGVLGISLATAIFPIMSADAAKKDFNALAKTISRGLKGAVFVAIPTTVGLFLVARPLVSAVFEHGEFTKEDTPIVAWTLTFYTIGLLGFFFQQILTRAFYSIQNSKIPMRSAIAAVLLNIVLNLILIWFMGTAGLAFSTAICSYLQVVILLVLLRRQFSSKTTNSILDGLAVTLIKTVIATIFMAVVGAGILCLCRNWPANTWFNIFRLAAVVPSAATVYFIAAKVLRTEQLALFKGAKQKTSKTTPADD